MRIEVLGELTNHIWQSTIFAVVVGLVSIAFRQNRAQIRYWLWLSASVKFLLPFSWLMSLGGRLDWAPATHRIASAPSFALTLTQVSQPFGATLPPAPSVRDAPDWTSLAIFGLWALGFTAIVLMRLRAWRRIQAAVRSSVPIDISTAIEVRSSSTVLEPGVVGFMRPILLLPAGIVQRLQPPQLEAVLAHELCHVRRRDNLTSAVHIIVEAIFWFHPLVWWIGARLVEERERACDEAVLSLGNAPRDYAEGILNVCKSYLESPLSCVSGVTGSNLKKRIQSILTGRIARDLTFAKRLSLVLVGVAAVSLPIAIGIVGAPRMRAQSQLAAPKFEAASVKACDGFRKASFPMYAPGTVLQSQCTTVERLVQQAYGLFADGRWNTGSSLTVGGGPDWIRSQFYVVDATAAAPQSRAMLNGPMLQALLEERFKLKFHRETRDVPIYALKVAEGGPKLRRFEGSCTSRDFDKPPSDADCGTASGWGNVIHMKAATLADLCAGLSVFLDRPVIDETGITGKFDMKLDLSAEDPELLNRPRSLRAVSNPTAPVPPLNFSGVRSAAKELGLNLEPAKGPIDVIVIDHIEKPQAI